jgi:hypothetical protein
MSYCLSLFFVLGFDLASRGWRLRTSPDVEVRATCLARGPVGMILIGP